MAKQQGITDEHIAELELRPSRLSSERELAALDLAEALWADAGNAGVNDALMQRLRAAFNEDSDCPCAI